MQKLFNLSEKQIIYSVFSIYFLYNFFFNLRGYMIGMGFPKGNPGPYPAGIAYIFKAFFIYQLIPLLLIFQLLWNRFKKDDPKNAVGETKYHSFILTTVLSAFIFCLTFLILLGGVDIKMVFFDYQTRMLNVIVYFSIVLYMTLLFRREDLLKLVLFVAWGLLVMAEVWEIPFNILSVGTMHPFVWLTGSIARWSPIFVWFILFHKTYIHLIMKKFLWLLPFVSIIILFTILNLFYREYYLNIFWSTSLRILYGVVLIVFPFHFHLHNEVKQN